MTDSRDLRPQGRRSTDTTTTPSPSTRAVLAAMVKCEAAIAAAVGLPVDVVRRVIFEWELHRP